MKKIGVLNRELSEIITRIGHNNMRDHQETCRMVFNASFTSSIPHIDTDTPEYDRISPVFYMGTLSDIGFNPTEYVDISAEIDTKLEALAYHESQIKWMLDHDHIDFLDFVKTCSKFRGLQCNVLFAEAFRQYAG